MIVMIIRLSLMLKRRISANHQRRDYEALISDEKPNIAQLRIRLFPELIFFTWSTHTLIEAIHVVLLGKQVTGAIALSGAQGVLHLCMPIIPDEWFPFYVADSALHNGVTNLIQLCVGVEVISEFMTRKELFKELFACPADHLRELQSTRFDHTSRGAILNERLTRGLEVNHEVALDLIDKLNVDAQLNELHRAMMAYRTLACVNFETLRADQTFDFSQEGEAKLVEQHQALLRGYRERLESVLPQSRDEIEQCKAPLLADLLSAIKSLALLDLREGEQSPELKPRESRFAELYLEALLSRGHDESLLLLQELAELCDQLLLFEDEFYHVLSRFNDEPLTSTSSRERLDRLLEKFGHILEHPQSKIQATALADAQRYAANRGWTPLGARSWRRPLISSNETQEVTYLPLKVSRRGDDSTYRGVETRLMITGPLLLDVHPISAQGFRDWCEHEGSIIPLKDGFFPVQSPPPEDHPESTWATYVSWYAAYMYCRAVKGRMISEAEWERAARGGLEGVSPHLSEVAGEPGLCLGVPESGLEWTGDRYRDDAYEVAGFIRPLIPGNDIATERVNRVYRGGLSASNNRERVTRMSGDPIGAALDQPLTFRVAFDIRDGGGQ